MDLVSADAFRRRQRRERITLIICVVGLVAWAVVSIAPPRNPDAEDERKVLPIKITSAEPALLIGSDVDKVLPPRPGEDTSITTQMLWILRRETTRIAGVRGKFSRARCEGGEIRLGFERNTNCGIVYEGIETTWIVSVKDVNSSGGYGSFIEARYDIQPITGVLLAKAVYGRFWADYHESSKELRCDKIPGSTSVKLDQLTGFECQYLALDGDQLRWTTLPVVLGRDGVRFSVGP